MYNANITCEPWNNRFLVINIHTNMYFSKQIENNGFVGNYICTYIYVHNQETNLTSHGFSCMYICMYITQSHWHSGDQCRAWNKETEREKEGERECVCVLFVIWLNCYCYINLETMRKLKNPTVTNVHLLTFKLLLFLMKRRHNSNDAIL